MRPALVCLALLALLPAAAARAQTRGVRIGATRSMTPIPISITREEVELDCQPADSDRGSMPCEIRVRITLANAATETVGAPLLFTLEHVEGVTIGEPGTTSATEAPTLRPLTFSVPPEGERTVELRGAIEITRGDSGSIGETDALAARHPLLASSSRGAERTFTYARPVAPHFVSVPDQVSFRIHVPDGYYLHTQDGWDVGGTSRDRVLTVHGPAEGRTVDIPIGIRTGEEVTEIIRNGGPFLAFGAAIGDGRSTTFRARAGYEIGFLDWLLVSVAVETDFTRAVELALMIEAASPSLIFPPSFSVGIGLPVRVWADPNAMPTAATPTVGLRLAAGATFIAVGFEALFDYWPADGSWVLGLLGRVGL